MGGGSFDPNGTIVSYSWNFGDGTSGTGPIVNHQYNASGVYSLSLSVSDNNGNSASSQGFVTIDSVAFPVKINFYELPNNTILADQYLSQYGVRFSSDNSLSPVHTWQICGGFCSTTSLPNFIWTYPNITGPTIVEFTQPASNLPFTSKA
jgi:PKD repeat protein